MWNKLVEITSHAEIVTEIVAQFAFMKIMAEEQDGNYEALDKLRLDEIYAKADNYFVEFTDDFGMIETAPCNLTEKLTQFLSEWSSIVDVEAIQQNIHHRLQLFDSEN